MKKKIDIDQLRPGMYVSSTNRSWLHLPFFRRKLRDEAIIQKLKSAGVTQVVIDTRKGDDIDDTDQRDPFDSPELLAENLSKSARVHDQVLDETGAMMEKVRSGGEISNQDADDQVNTLMDQILDDPQSMLCVSVLKNADEFTFNHCVNTAILALFVGQSLKLAPNKMLTLGKGALLHDIGKCMIPNEILIKPGKLDESEAHIIRTHVDKGVRYLQRMKGMQPEVIEMVAHHHERMDGTGYPAGLKGDQLCFMGKLIAVLDVYDALIHANYYKESTDPTAVLKTMATSVGEHYCEESFKALSDCIGIYPPGTILMLDSGEIALTYEPNHKNPYRPKVLLLTRIDGSFHERPTPVRLTETIQGKHKYKRSVLTTMSLEETNFNPFEILGKYSLQSMDIS